MKHQASRLIEVISSNFYRMKDYLKIIFVAVASFILIPLRAVSFSNEPTFCLFTFVYSVACFILTVYLLNKYSDKLKPWKIILVFLFIVLLPDIWVRAFAGHFISSLPSLPDCFLRILVVLLAWVYFKISKAGKIILSTGVLLICIWTSSYGLALWNTCNWVNSFKEDEISITEVLACSDDVAEKEKFTEQLKGKATLLFFWKMDDKKSIEQLPLLQQIYESYKERKDIAILSIACNGRKNSDNLSDRLEFLQKNRFTVPCLSIDESKCKLQLNYLPALLLINKNGKIIFKSGGTESKGATGLTNMGNLDEMIDFLNK